MVKESLMELQARLRRLMRSPTAHEVWNLRGDLLQRETSSDDPIWEVLEQFYRYLCQLESSSTSREHSHRASLLDIGAVGGVVLERLLEGGSPAQTGRRLLSALMSEGLMVLATRQHVKAWEQELANVYAEAAWQLYDQLWKWSLPLRPELKPGARRVLIEQLLAPIRSEEPAGTVKAVLITRYYQLLLWTRLRQSRRVAE